MYSEAAWSLIDNRPIFLYVESRDAHVCYWNGVAITRTYALLIYYTQWLNLYPTESMKMPAWCEFQRLERMNIFGNGQRWVEVMYYQTSANFHLTLTQLISGGNSNSFFDDMRQKHSASSAILWFHPDREIIKHGIEF